MRSVFEKSSFHGFRREGGYFVSGERVSEETLQKLVESEVVATLPSANSADEFLVKLEEENAKIIEAAGSELLHESVKPKAKMPAETQHKFGRNKYAK